MKSYSQVNGQLGFGFLITALLIFVMNGIAVKFGKRTVFLLSLLVVWISSFYSAFSKTWASFLASMLIGSIGRCPIDVLVTATVADLYPSLNLLTHLDTLFTNVASVWLPGYLRFISVLRRQPFFRDSLLNNMVGE